MDTLINNTKRFSGKAEIYQKYRPSYSEDYICYLKELVGKNTEVADIGSGTGILSAQLMRAGFQVTGVEPNADMRELAEEILKGDFISVNGSAEATGLPDESIGLITVGQAFHWFDRTSFQAECKRILKPDGLVSLVWNQKVMENEISREAEKVILRLCPGYNGSSNGIGFEKEMFDGFFHNGKYEKRIFQNNIRSDRKGFVGRHLSSSYAPLPGDEQYDVFRDELLKLFNRYEKDGWVLLPNLTVSYTGKVK